KETMQALYVLAFVLALRWGCSGAEGEGGGLRRFLPAAAIAAGCVYSYSFAGLAWPLAITALAVVALLAARRPVPWGAAAAAAALLAALSLPELGRMIDFQGFETF